MRESEHAALGTRARTATVIDYDPFAAEVLDLRGLVLAVAAQLLLEVPGSTKVTQRWLTEVCQPTPQATLDLLQVVPAALNRTARALNTDLAIPGVVVASTTTLVAP